MGMSITQRDLQDAIYCPFQNDGCNLSCGCLVRRETWVKVGERPSDDMTRMVDDRRLARVELSCGLADDKGFWNKANTAIFEDSNYTDRL